MCFSFFKKERNFPRKSSDVPPKEYISGLSLLLLFEIKNIFTCVYNTIHFFGGEHHALTNCIVMHFHHVQERVGISSHKLWPSCLPFGAPPRITWDLNFMTQQAICLLKSLSDSIVDLTNLKLLPQCARYYHQYCFGYCCWTRCCWQDLACAGLRLLQIHFFHSLAKIDDTPKMQQTTHVCTVWHVHRTVHTQTYTSVSKLQVIAKLGASWTVSVWLQTICGMIWI